MRYFRLVLLLTTVCFPLYSLAAEQPNIAPGFFEATLISSTHGNGPLTIYTPHDLSDAIVIGTFDNVSDGFYDNSIPIVINRIQNEPSGIATKTELDGLLGDGINIVYDNNSGSIVGGFFTLQSGNSGLLQGANPNFPFEPGSGHYQGTFSGNCDSGARSGTLNALVRKSDFGSNVGRMHLISRDTNDLKEGLISFLASNASFSASAPSGALFQGTFDFTTQTALGTWLNATDNCTGTWTMGLIKATTEAAWFANASAALPIARSVQVGNPANVFATIVNPYLANDAIECRISFNNVESLPIDFLYQTTDPITNALVGTVNTPATIPPGDSQSFLISLTPTAEVPENLLNDIRYNCINTNLLLENTINGLNAVTLVAETNPVADVIALTTVVDLPLNVNVPGVFAVASVNIGAAADITVSPATFNSLVTSICQTDTTGQCMGTPTPSVTLNIGMNETPTFAIFVTATESINSNFNRLLINFEEAGVLRGSTSTAVRTQ